MKILLAVAVVAVVIAAVFFYGKYANDQGQIQKDATTISILKTQAASVTAVAVTQGPGLSDFHAATMQGVSANGAAVAAGASPSNQQNANIAPVVPPPVTPTVTGTPGASVVGKTHSNFNL